jgi:hypothetical protein
LQDDFKNALISNLQGFRYLETELKWVHTHFLKPELK